MATEAQPKPNTAVETYVRWNKATGWGLLAYGLIGLAVPILPLDGLARVVGPVNLAQGYGIEGFRKWRARRKAEKGQTPQLKQSDNVVELRQSHNVYVSKSDPRESGPIAA